MPPARPRARPAHRSVPLALLAVALAGCLTAPAPGTDPASAGPQGLAGSVRPDRLPAPEVDFATAIDPDHGGIPDGHAIAALHEGSHGLELVGYNPLTRAGAGDDPLSQDSAYAAIDVWEHYVCVAHWVGTGGIGGGATIVDIADPADPVVVASLPSAMINSDCQFTDDGKYLVVAAYTGVHEGLALPPPLAGPPLGDAAAQGVLVYDVQDKAAPRFLFHDSQGAAGSGYHNVFTAQIHGTHYLFQTYTGHILALDEGATALRPVAQVDTADHDMWIGQHPVTGRWVMATGAGGGTIVYDLEDPANPRALGAWEAHDAYTGWHRQWPLMDLVEGRALLVVAGETGGGASLPYTVLDWTDPAELVELGHWHIPGEPVSAEPNFFTFSAHEFETWDGYVAAGNYHAGVWLFDIGTLARAREPVTLGYYLPHEIPQLHGGTGNKPWMYNPDTWGAYFDARGYVITADWSTGLYVLRFGATTG